MIPFSAIDTVEHYSPLSFSRAQPPYFGYNSLTVRPTIEQSDHIEFFQKRALKNYIWFYNSNNDYEQLCILHNLPSFLNVG